MPAALSNGFKCLPPKLRHSSGVPISVAKDQAVILIVGSLLHSLLKLEHSVSAQFFDCQCTDSDRAVGFLSLWPGELEAATFGPVK